MDEQEKPKAIIKRPVKVSASYVKPNFKIVDGKMVYDRSFKSFKQEENDKILGAYQKRNGKPLKEDATKIREENERRREESIKRRKEDARKTKIIADKLQEKETLTKKTVISKTNNTNTQVKNVNLFAELKIGEDDKSILLDVIKYSLSAREITILKDFYGSKYDWLNRKTNSKETKSNASRVLNKIKPKLEEALKIKNDKLKYRYYLLSFKNEVEYIPQNIFKDIPKSTLENAYKKLTMEEEGIAKKYFDSLKGEELTDEELIVFSNVIYPKLNVYVFSPKGIDAYFKVYTADEQKILRDIIKFLSENYLEIIKKKFGENLNGQNREKLSNNEAWNFNKTIVPKIEKKYQELREQKGTCDYYISLIKGFSSLNIEANCNVKDEIDKKILLDLLEKLNERDLNILFTTEELSKITRSELTSRRYRITNYLRKSILELRKVYDDRKTYKSLLEQLLNGNPINEVREKQTVNKQEDKKGLTVSFASYLEKVSLNILEDVINYALVEDEKEFIYTLFNGDYGKSVVTKLKNKVKRFNKINIKINSFINYIVEFIEEYEEFLNRLKDFPRDEDYNLYQIKDLKTFLDIPYDANLKFILKNGLDKEEKLLLQKRFGLTYEGFLARKIDSKEKYSLRLIKDKVIKQYKLLEVCNEQEEVNKLEIILNLKKEKKPHEKGYKYTSLIEYLGIKDEDLEKFYKIMENIFNEDERTLLQNRFGPKYDGVFAIKIFREDNIKIFVSLIPRLNTKLNYKNKSLREFLGLSKDDQNILNVALKTIPLNEIELLKKGFGTLYDGENSNKLTNSENVKLNQTIKPRILNAIKIIKETDEKDLEKELNKLISKYNFGYLYLSLYEFLGLSLSDKDLLINSINKKFGDEQIVLLQKRFGPLYDGIDIVGVTKEENKLINLSYIPILKCEINKKLGIKKEPRVKKESKTNNYVIEHYHQKSLFKYLNVLDEEKFILLNIINVLSVDDQKLLQRRFGSLYDGEGTLPITLIERTRIFKTLIPQIKEIFLTLKKTTKEEYSIVLRTWAYKLYKRKKETKDLLRVMNWEEYEKEQRKNITKVVAIEEVEVRKEIYIGNEKITYLRDLVKILDEEKKRILKKYRKELLDNKYNLLLFNSKLKIYALNLVPYGFTKEEAMFILLITTEELNISKAQLLSLLGIDEEVLSEIYLNSINKIKNLLSNELDNYLSLLKEKRDNYE